MNIKLITLVVLMMTSSLFATIVVTPKSINEVDKLSLEVGLSGSITKGNTDKKNISLDIILENGDGKNHKHLLIGAYSYGKSNDVKDIEKGLIHYRYTSNTYGDEDYELFVQEEFNEFQNTKQRFLVGGNFRERFPHFDRLFVGAGLFYENISPEKNTQDHAREHIRYNLYTAFKHKFNENIAINGLIYFQPSIFDIKNSNWVKLDDFRLTSKFTLVNKLTDYLNFNTNLNYSYISKPFIGIEKDDLKLTIGFSYKI